MIEKIDSFQKLDAFKDKNIFTVRIKSLAHVYGFGFSFASFYRQIINNETAAVFSVLDSDITLAVDANCADFDELAEFSMLRGFTSLMCSDDFILDGEYDHGVIMECRCKFDLLLRPPVLWPFGHCPLYAGRKPSAPGKRRLFQLRARKRRLRPPLLL